MAANKWNDDVAQECADAAGDSPADRQLALQIYASRLIGNNPELVQHGGGNTSCKVIRRDLFGDDMRVMHIKGSGHDLATIGTGGMPAIRLEPALKLRQLDQLSDEDMVNALRASMLDASGPTPSIESLLHAFLPFGFINHSHATAMLALADLPDAEAATAEIFGSTVATVPFIKPGFDLAKVAAKIFDANEGLEGLILLQHGHFSFADDPKTAYERMIRHTTMVEDWLRAKSGKVLAKSGPPAAHMVEAALNVLPRLRGIIGQRGAEHYGDRDAAMPVLDLRAGPNVQEFLTRPDLGVLARRGVATPDHVIRTKNYPLFLTADILAGGGEAIAQAVDGYIQSYTAYFHENAQRYHEEKTLLNAVPDVAWIEGVGVVGMGRDARGASVAADLAEQNIAAMSLGEDSGGFFPVGEADLFDMEYWSLEQAKLASSRPPALAGRVVMITGGAGGIGLATARAFAAAGANTFLVDLQEQPLAQALKVLGAGHGGLALDITAPTAAQRAMDACVARFGGLDILVSNAGAAWTGEMIDLDDALLRKSFELNFFAHQVFSKAAARIFDNQNRGGQILFNVSKQAVNPGKGFGAYGLPKATTMFLLRQLALELGPKGVRVNGINADRIRSGLLDDVFISERSKARGIDESTYMAGNLLHREVEARHVADAFVALALSERTTAHVMTVDGGNIEAALR